MSNLDLDIYTGYLQRIYLNLSQQKDHIDTLKLERNGDRYEGNLASEMFSGFDSYQSHTAEVTGIYNHEIKRLELEYSYDEESFNRLYFIYKDDKIMGCYPDLNDTYDEWTHKLVKDVFF